MRKVTFVINSRANYARIKTVVREAVKREDIEASLIVGASGVLHRFGNVADIMRVDGFDISREIYSVVEGDSPVSMVKTTGISMLSLADEFHNIKPDIVVTVADRYETIATAIAASYMNIPVAHTQGGEVTGSIDDSVRNAITKLSHIHFPATHAARTKLIELGENPSSIFNFGCPAIDLAHEVIQCDAQEVFEKYHGVGQSLDFTEPYILVSQHPDTLSHGEARLQISETLEAVAASDIQTVWLWPNVDSGSDQISKRLREFREANQTKRIRFYRNFSAEDYINVLRHSACIVGNSSSGIREANFLGVPAVNVGERQRGRERGRNVVDVPYEKMAIARAIREQAAKKGSMQGEYLYGEGKAGIQIAEILASHQISIRK
jgi:UDP-hydrolysing UDP-N-acetyl-D-glucosamine 2-epimerase